MNYPPLSLDINRKFYMSKDHLLAFFKSKGISIQVNTIKKMILIEGNRKQVIATIPLWNGLINPYHLLSHIFRCNYFLSVPIDIEDMIQFVSLQKIIEED